MAYLTYILTFQFLIFFLHDIISTETRVITSDETYNDLSAGLNEQVSMLDHLRNADISQPEDGGEMEEIQSLLYDDLELNDDLDLTDEFELHDDTGMEETTEGQDYLENERDGEEYISWEGDMRLSSEQLKDLYGSDSIIDDISSHHTRTKRKAVRRQSALWDNAIVYYRFAPRHFSPRDRLRIKSAMEEWEQHTCLKFHLKKPRHRDFILFESGSTCSSYVGRQGGNQSLILGPQCRRRKVALHEIGHALGFLHEHNRPDRDSYVHVHYQNIERSEWENFHKYRSSQVATMGVPYDYLSIMHYGSHFFSTNAQPTLTVATRDQHIQRKMGRVRHLSFSDIKQANLMYSCGAKCDPSITCPQDGFLSKDCQCLCPGNPVKLCNSPAATTISPTTTTEHSPVSSESVTSPGPCEDRWSLCGRWQSQGLCQEHRFASRCPRTCGLCNDSDR